MKPTNARDTQNFTIRDFPKIVFAYKRILKAINVVAIIGDIGLYLMENDVKII